MALPHPASLTPHPSSLIPLRSEFSRPRLRPSLDDDLFLSEELEGVASLSVQIAEEAFTGAAEREEGHRRRDADVDADVADFGLVLESACVGAARREQRRLIPVRA